MNIDGDPFSPRRRHCGNKFHRQVSTVASFDTGGCREIGSISPRGGPRHGVIAKRARRSRSKTSDGISGSASCPSVRFGSTVRRKLGSQIWLALPEDAGDLKWSNIR
jgi:hypothetical protein